MAEKSIIYVDVGRLVEKVETRNLLFYPVMIHIFWQVMRNLYKGEVNEPCPVYQIMQGNGQNVLAWQEMKDDREAFLPIMSLLVTTIFSQINKKNTIKCRWKVLACFMPKMNKRHILKQICLCLYCIRLYIRMEKICCRFPCAEK